MGILQSKEDTSNERPNPQPPAKPKKVYSPAEIFAVKEDYLECWTTPDVVNWLEHKELSQYIQPLQQLFITGDGLLHLHRVLSQLEENNNSNNNNNNNNNNTEVTDIDATSTIKDPIAISKANVLIIDTLKQIDPEAFEPFRILLDTICAKYLKSGGKDKSSNEYADYVPEIPVIDEDNVVYSWKKVVMFYHLTTQHTKTKGSRSVDRNWFNQPRIFRRYYMAPYIRLPFPKSIEKPDQGVTYNALFDNSLQPSNLNPTTLSEFLFFSLSLSGCRETWELASMPRAAWSKRVNPSSGGLHPIETYLILGSNTYSPTNNNSNNNNSGGVFHYNPQQHVLEKRTELSDDVISSILGQNNENGFIIGVSSIHWREVWKYGERAFRYCMLDAGHTIGAITISALRLGWRARIVNGVDAKTVENMLGLTLSNTELDPCEQERGLVLIAVTTNPNNKLNIDPYNLTSFADNLASDPEKWLGSPNHLSQTHYKWDVVFAVDKATRGAYVNTPEFTEPVVVPPQDPTLSKLSTLYSADHVIRSRRSALDFKGTPITLNQFLHIMWTLTPKTNPLPWNVMSLPPQINLFLFVYNVEGLAPGLYALIRNNEEFIHICNATKASEFLWELVPNEFDVPLYLLVKLETEKTGKTSYETSCHQSIASHKHGAFSVGMFANFESILGLVPDNQEKGTELGPNGYLAAHYESGLIGHLLYLEAHALGFGATGMGCFLDDLSRETFGFDGANSFYYPLYHFAIGHPDTSASRYKIFDYSHDMFDGVLQECVDCTLR